MQYCDQSGASDFRCREPLPRSRGIARRRCLQGPETATAVRFVAIRRRARDALCGATPDGWVATFNAVAEYSVVTDRTAGDKAAHVGRLIAHVLRTGDAVVARRERRRAAHMGYDIARLRSVAEPFVVAVGIACAGRSARPGFAPNPNFFNRDLNANYVPMEIATVGGSEVRELPLTNRSATLRVLATRTVRAHRAITITGLNTGRRCNA